MRPLINLYIYSSLHIAICAVALTLSSYFLFDLEINLYYISFVGAGTMFIYSIHRIVGIQKSTTSSIENRFSLIRKYKSHLVIYAAIAIVIASYSFYSLEWNTKIALLIPALLSALYVLPLFINHQRLRDFNYLKIFLVAACWAWLCGLIPLYENGLQPSDYLLFLLEKSLFIFAITLPFDFRDILVDEEAKVKTLAHLFGNKIKYATIAAFIICILLVFITPYYSDSQKITLLITYLILEMITRYSMSKKHDFYYSGVIDGTMILFFILMILGQQLIH